MASAVSAFAPPSVERASRTAQSVTMTPFAREEMKLQRSTARFATSVEAPKKLYVPNEKEVPKVLGGLKIGLRELAVVTGASSGLGLQAAKTLAKSGKYFVVMACRDVEKAKKGKLVFDYIDSRALLTVV